MAQPKRTTAKAKRTSLHTSISESEGALIMAKPETKKQCEVDFEDEHKRFRDRYAVLCTSDFSEA
jgi:hypothetical protein